MNKNNFAGKKILIVDDDASNIFVLSRMLQKSEVEIHTANNGQEALDMLEEMPTIDCVLMDMMMPVMDGYEAIESIRNQDKWAKLPVISVTAQVMEGDKNKCIEIGATAYIPKPVNKDMLMATLSDNLMQIEGEND